MPDFDAITIALAARFAPAQVTPPAGGYGNVTVSTGNLPEGGLPPPFVLVFAESGEFTHYPGKRDSKHEFVVRFYYNQDGDMERDTIALRKWATVLVDQLKLSAQLGGIVTLANVTGWTIGKFGYPGSEVMFTGVELTVEIVVNEAWAAVA